MFNWFNRIAILLFSFLSLTVYFQHEHNHNLSVELTAANHALDDADAMINANRLAQQRADELDKKYTEQLADAQTQIDKLRSDVISGRRQLRIKARCVSGNTKSGGVGFDSTVELSPETGSTVLDIRSGIVSDQIKIKYLQDYINQITHQ